MIVFLGTTLALIILAVVLRMLIKRSLREKYAAMWIIIALAVLILGVFPQLLTTLTDLLGVQLPSNLLFALAIVLLLGVALHLSWELSRAEDEIRRLAEEAAIANTVVAQLESRVAVLEAATRRDDDTGPV